MASNQEEVTVPMTLELKYWVDTAKKRVVVAEASGDFIDVLFSFLTLPLGTIMRRFESNQNIECMSCIRNLYKSVKPCSDVFSNKENCEQMLVSPRNPLEATCQRLKLKVDDTQPAKYFMCSSCSSDLLLSTFDGAKCRCGELMNKDVELKEEPFGENNGVFVNEKARFLIFDDLTVIQNSPGDSIQPLLKRRHKNLEDMSQEPEGENIDPEKIFSLLKHALTSKSPLSDALLGNSERSKRPWYYWKTVKDLSGPSDWKGSIKIKVTVSKSQNKILFAEADGEFVDFLFSFLTTPLGSILNLMNRKLRLGSIGNLYESVKDLNPSWFIGSSQESLINPRVAPHFGCKRNPLNASQEDTPKYWYGTPKDNTGSISTQGKVISKKKNILQDPKKMILIDPRSSDDGARQFAEAFMKRPWQFVVSDDLKVEPLTATHSISYLKKCDVKLNDLEEHLVEIRKSHEALNLLRASLTFKEAVLTRSLSYQLRKWKFQRFIPLWSVAMEWKEKRDKKKKRKTRWRNSVGVKQ